MSPESLLVESGQVQTIISGRGVITGEQFPWHSPLFEWALVNIDQGTQNVVDGLVLVDSPEFHLASFTDRPTIRNGALQGASGGVNFNCHVCDTIPRRCYFGPQSR